MQKLDIFDDQEVPKHCDGPEGDAGGKREAGWWYMDICHDNPVALTPMAVRRLMDVYKRHLALMAPVGLFVPKHHLMLHVTHRASSFGNPSLCATWREERPSRDLKRALRNCQRFIEERAFTKLGSRARPIQAPPTEVSDPCILKKGETRRTITIIDLFLRL